MPAPVSFNLPTFGAAPNQYSTETALEQAVQAVLDAIFDTLAGEIRSRRVATSWTESFAAVAFPRDTAAIVQASGAKASVWVKLVPAPSPATALDQQDRDGIWWRRVWDSADNVLALRNAGVFSLVDVAGTADAITANLHASAVSLGVTIDGSTMVEIVPVANNTGGATLQVGTDTARAIQTETGAALPANTLRAGVSALLRRRGNAWRIVSGGLTTSDFSAERTARALADAAGSVVMLENIGGTGDAITAEMPAALTGSGVAASNLRHIRFTVPAANTLAGPTLNIGGTGAVGIYDNGNAPVAVGALQPGYVYEAEKVIGRWRLMGVTPVQLNAVISRIAAVEPVVRTVTNADGAANRSTATYITPNTDVTFNPGGEGGLIIKAPPANGNVALVNARMSVRRRGDAVVQSMFLADGKVYEKAWIGNVEGAWADKTPYAPVVRVTINASALGLAQRDFNVLTAVDTTYTADGSALFYNLPFDVDTYGGKDGTGYANGRWQTLDLGPMRAQYYWHAGQPDYAPFVRYLNKDTSSWSPWVRAREPIANGPAIVAFGDSITAGVGVGANNPDAYALRTASLLNSPITRLATAGRMMCGTAVGDFIPQIDLPANAPAISGAGLIWVAYGTNDWGAAVPLGLETDAVNGTFYGAMKEGLTKLRALNPTAKITFLTPIYRGKAYSNPLDWSEAGQNSLGLLVEDYRAAIRRFCAINGLPVSEMSYNSEINPATAATYLPADALHPGMLGHRWMADRLVARLRSWGWA